MWYREAPIVCVHGLTHDCQPCAELNDAIAELPEAERLHLHELAEAHRQLLESKGKPQCHAKPVVDPKTDV